MRPAVRAAFVGFSSKFEGVCQWMYLDVKGLVTTGIGNLIDPIGLAVGLPFLRSDGSPASTSEIAAEWQYVKSLQDKRLNGGGWFASATKLRLSGAGVDQVVQGKLVLVEGILKSRFPDWESWPADAQLGVLSMAWAMGAGFNFPHFDAAAQKRDWTTCTNECHMDDTGNPGLRPRNAANVQLFQNAARVESGQFDPSVLYWPSSPIGP